jgi:hypothetical protein
VNLRAREQGKRGVVLHIACASSCTNLVSISREKEREGEGEGERERDLRRTALSYSASQPSCNSIKSEVLASSTLKRHSSSCTCVITCTHVGFAVRDLVFAALIRHELVLANKERGQ